MTKKFLSLEKLTEYDTLIKDKINSVNTIEVSATEPTGENVAVWLNPSSEDTINIPEINDSTTSLIDTWSSQKINSELASAGKVKTVNGIEPDENGNIKISVSGGTSTGGVTSWNDLIDKPFEDNVDGREVVAEKQSLTLNKTDVCVGDTSVEFHYIQYINENPLGIPFNDGDKLIYIWNGVEYECTTTCIYDEVEKLDIYKIGNENIVNSRVEDTGVPFFIAMMKAETMYMFQISSRLENASLEIQKVVKTVKHIDNKYIKDMYGSKTTEEVYIPLQDYTFTAYVDQDTNTADTWSEGIILLTGTYEGMNIGDTIFVTWDGVEYECVVMDMQGVPFIGNAAMFGGEDNGIPFVIGFDIAGMLSGTPCIVLMNIYDPAPDDANDTITHSISIKKHMEELVQIKPKYIKDMYYCDEEVLLKSQELQFKYTEEDGCLVQVSLVSPIVPDKVYTIEFDGICYEGLSAQNPAGQIVVEFPRGEDEKIGAILQVDGRSFIFTQEKTDSVHTVAISEVKSLAKIPSKYLPTDYIKKLINDAITTALNTEV